MKIKFCFLIYFIIFFINNSFSGGNEEYVKKYKQFSVKPFFAQRFHSLVLVDKSNDDYPILYSTNTLLNTGLDLHYKFLTVSFSVKIPSTKKNEQRFGESDYKQFGLAVNVPFIGVSAYYQNYTGFYLLNAKVFNENFNMLKDSFPQTPDMSVTNFDMNINFRSSRKFSINAALNQSEKQLKNAGSLFFSLYYNYFSISNHSIPLDANQQNKIINLKNLTSGFYNSLGIAGGYGYTYLFKENYFITGVGQIGVYLQHQYNNFSGEKTWEFKPGLSFNSIIALGYNTDKYFASAQFDINYKFFNIKNAFISSMPIRWKIGVGMRFEN